MKESLNKYFKEYNNILVQIEILELVLKMTESDFEVLKVEEFSSANFSNYSKIAYLKEKKYRTEKELSLKKIQINKLDGLVSKLTGLEKKIIKMKYLNNMTTERIAYELGYSYNHIKNKYRNCMEILNFVAGIEDD